MDSQVPLTPKLLNRKQHRKPEAQFCCHRASAHVFWSVSIEQASLIPSHHAWLFSPQSSLCTAHVSLKPWSPSKHLIAPGCSHAWTWNCEEGRTNVIKVSFEWKNIIVEKIPEASPLWRSLTTDWYVPKAKRWWAHPLLKGQWLTAQTASLALGLNLLSLVIKLKLLFLEAFLFIS